MIAPADDVHGGLDEIAIRDASFASLSQRGVCGASATSLSATSVLSSPERRPTIAFESAGQRLRSPDGARQELRLSEIAE